MWPLTLIYVVHNVVLYHWVRAQCRPHKPRLTDEQTESDAKEPPCISTGGLKNYTSQLHQRVGMESSGILPTRWKLITEKLFLICNNQRRGVVIYWSYSMFKSNIPSQIHPTSIILSIVHLYITFSAGLFKTVGPSFIKTEYLCPSARRACRPAEWKELVKFNSRLLLGH